MHHDSHYEERTTGSGLVARLLRATVRCGREFCLGTSMHGFNHIALPGRYWFERILWACVTAAAIWGAVDISLGQLQRYNANPIVVALEKDFRTWEFNYPGVTVCLMNRVDPSKLPEVIKEFWNIEPDDEKYSYYSDFVATVANSDLFHLEGYHAFKDDNTLNVDLVKLTVDVMPDFGIKDIWSEGVTPTWFPIMTESGACYTTNSMAIADVATGKPDSNETKMFPMKCKYASMSCYIALATSSNINVYVHSTYDVVDIAVPPSKIIMSLNRVVELSVMETGCGRGVKQLTPQRRGCQYTDEPLQEGRQVYSTNSCRLSCRSRLAIKLCGCKPFYYFYEGEGATCTPAGMSCLSSHAHTLTNNGGVRCVCAQQCLDSVYTELSIDDQYWTIGPFMKQGSVRLTVQAPQTRYTREIVFHFQDLVVSFGGAAGLFLGASFISFVEIFYFVLVRVLRILVVDNPTKGVSKVEMKAPVSSVPYEMLRINDLTRILEREQRRYNYNDRDI